MPVWGLVSAAAAPVLLVGGWTLAAARQSPPVDATEVTISALAARGADDPWLMTAALAGLGLCHATTAAALRPAAPAGRAVLALGGVATLGVAAAPLPVEGGSTPHAAAALVAFVALSAWPALARRPPARGGRAVPRVLRAPASVAATAALTALLAAFAVSLATGREVGLTERLLAGAQALWPLAVVVALRRHRARPGGRH